VEYLKELLKAHGLVLKSAFSMFVIAAAIDKHPGYAGDNVIGRFLTVEEAIAFIAGWSRHVECVRLSGDYVKKKHHPGSNRKKVKTKP
jgi:hypothetical protein